MGTIALVFDYLRITFKGVVQYRANFISGVIGLALSSVFQLLAAVVVVQRFGTADGWDMGQIAFMFGIWRIQYGFMLILFSPIWSVDFLIRESTIDRFLVRPRSLLVQVPGVRFNVSGVGQVLAGTGMAAFGAAYSPLDWSPWMIPWLAVILVSGTVIQMAVWLFMASFNFYHVRVDSTIRTTDRTSWQINLFPISVYSLAVQALLTFGIPWAFMVFYPAHLLYGRGSDIFIGSPVMYLAPLVAAIAALVAGFFWRLGLRQYQGLGGV